jgi:glycosyltransferase involved in cell wall biosynthesis
VRVTYVLLSPTYGMHQYTADLANRWLTVEGSKVAGCRFGSVTFEPSTSVEPQLAQSPTRVITTANVPRDRYAPTVDLLTPLTTHGTGFSPEGLNLPAYRRVVSSIFNLQSSIHFTGVHAWNVPLVYALRRHGVPVVHTLHDLDPHQGVRFAAAIRLWNRLIIRSGAHIVVHGQCYRDRLIAGGLAPERVTFLPLLHGFWGHEAEADLVELENQGRQVPQPARPPLVIFFGRIEAYKGVDTLLAAWEQLMPHQTVAHSSGPLQPRLVIAGRAAPGVQLPALPPGVELRDRRIDDAEGMELFRRASVLVLPYRDGTQSALPAAAYRFGVPVIATDSGALGEYVVPGKTGWVIPPGDVAALAGALAEALAAPDCLQKMGLAGQLWYHRARAQEEAAFGQLYRQLSED